MYFFHVLVKICTQLCVKVHKYMKIFFTNFIEPKFVYITTVIEITCAIVKSQFHVLAKKLLQKVSTCTLNIFMYLARKSKYFFHKYMYLSL